MIDYDPDSIDANAFIDLLGLRGKRFQSTSLDGLIMGVYDYASEIWRSGRLYTFVDHGVSHSYMVLYKALDIFDKIKTENHDLSPIERTILGISSLIHDIGMQYEKYPKKGCELNYRQIRDGHVQIGFEMIRETINGSFQKDRGGPFLAMKKPDFSFLHYGAIVGFAHSGRIYWDKLKETHLSNDSSGGQFRRLRLLASLIRLGDELHCEYTRIPEINFINSNRLDDEGKAHWCSCYYTQNLEISSPGHGAVRMHMHWRVPESANEEKIEEIRTLLQEFREKKINNECKLIQEYIVLKKGSEPCMLDFRLEPDPERDPSVSKLPDLVSKYIRSKLRPYQYGVKKFQESEKIRELKLAPEREYVRRHAKDYFLKGSGIKSGHYRLKTRWHTDRFVNCRDLCSDIDYLTDLCTALSSHYSEYGFTDILAIGTSAIGIATLLGAMLNTKVSFTFESVADEASEKGQYTDYERGLPEFSGSKLLIIDDILGVGSVLYKIVSIIEKRENIPSLIHAFCMYSLGQKPFSIGHSPSFTVDYLISFPDVSYWKEDKGKSTCEACLDLSTSLAFED